MIELKNISTIAPAEFSKKNTKKDTNKIAQKIGELSRIYEADKSHSLLIVFQGMDTSGKDGATRETFKYVSPNIVCATSFKKPTDLEMSHDFLWRVHKEVPAKGKIKVFNRSHYEDILIQRVHNWIDDEMVEKRMKSINDFEELLQYDNNTTILKFYLHISREKQKEKLQERIDVDRKNWKHNPGDWKEAELWNKYMKAYEYTLNNSAIPWIIVPADQRWYRNHLVAKTVLEALEKMNLKYPLI